MTDSTTMFFRIAEPNRALHNLVLLLVVLCSNGNRLNAQEVPEKTPQATTLVQRSQQAALQGEYQKAIEHIGSALKQEPSNLELLFFAARLHSAVASKHHEGKQYGAAVKACEQCVEFLQRIQRGALKLDVDQQQLLSSALYNKACAESMNNDAGSAIESLRLAIDAGYFNVAHMRRDPDLELAREEPAFKSVLSGMMKRPLVRSKLLLDKGTELYQRGDYAESTVAFRESLEILRQVYSKEEFPNGHLFLATTLNNLGGLLRVQAEFDAAREAHQEALEMLRKLYPEEASNALGQRGIAASLAYLGMVAREQGDYETALANYRDSLQMVQRLFPIATFPDGHSELVDAMNRLGLLCMSQGKLRESRRLLEEALQMQRRLFPADKFPEGHLNLVNALSSFAGLLEAEGDYVASREHFEQALAMLRKLYPFGHPQVAVLLNNLAGLLKAQGEYVRARAHYEESWKSLQRFCPPGHPDLALNRSNLGTLLLSQGEYADARQCFDEAIHLLENMGPNGHPWLASTLDHLGTLLVAQGDFGKACETLDRALKMQIKLFPADRYPDGHESLAQTLHNLAMAYAGKGDNDSARKHLERSMAIHQKLFPADRFPDGHPQVAASLFSLGNLAQSQGMLQIAKDYFEEALTMERRLYSDDGFPDGHPDLVNTIDALGMVTTLQGNDMEAADLFIEALAMNERLTTRFASGASEVELLNLLERQRDTLSNLVSISSHKTDSCYGSVWNARGLVQRVAVERQSLLAKSSDSVVQAKLARYRETRRSLARFLFAPFDPDPTAAVTTAERMGRLSREKERLERDLASTLSGFSDWVAGSQRRPSELVAALPSDVAFVDFLRYNVRQRNPVSPAFKGETSIPKYVAFVMQKGRPLSRVELGRAQPIEEAIIRWRAAIRAEQRTNADEQLRELIWLPIEQSLIAPIRTIYLCPDAALTSIPWPALPGKKRGSILLENYRLATVPHGSFLLNQLRGETRRDFEKILSVGGVDYDGGSLRSMMNLLAKAIRPGEAPRDTQRTDWQPLPNSKSEATAIAELSEDLEVHLLTGRRADTVNVLSLLRQVEIAHFATHGFFADSKFRAQRQISETYFVRSPEIIGRDRQAVGARNPLLGTGMVLAGANRTDAQVDNGILTGEAIAALPLSALQLAVLSACETNVGEVASREGVFSLQRAFHNAGTRNVIASLWKVPDGPTAALMTRFYVNLLQEHQSPLESLRNAQLAIYKNPEKIDQWASERSLLSKETKRLSNDEASRQAADGQKPKGGRSPVRWWAAFTLSGSGS